MRPVLSSVQLHLRAAFNHLSDLPAIPRVGVIVVVVLIWYFNAPGVETLPPLAHKLYSWTSSFGLAAILIAAVVRAIQLSFEGDMSLRPVLTATERFLLLNAALLSIRQFHESCGEVLDWGSQNPTDVLVVQAGAVIVVLLFQLSPSPTSATTRYEVASVLGKVVRERQIPRNPLLTPIHEAGHALLYAAWEEPPENLVAEYFPEATEPGVVRGSVSGRPSPQPTTRSYTYWSMQTHLAGTVAEEVLLYDRADGSSRDSSDWMIDAQRYLQSGFGKPFFVVPATREEIEHNCIILADLKEKQEDELRAFFNANREVLLSLANRLQSEHRIECHVLTQFFSQTLLTAGIARVARTPDWSAPEAAQ